MITICHAKAGRAACCSSRGTHPGHRGSAGQACQGGKEHAKTVAELQTSTRWPLIAIRMTIMRL